MNIDVTVYLDTLVLNYARRMCKLDERSTEYISLLFDYDAAMSEWLTDDYHLAQASNQLKTRVRVLNELRID